MSVVFVFRVVSQYCVYDNECNNLKHQSLVKKPVHEGKQMKRLQLYSEFDKVSYDNSMRKIYAKTFN